MRSICQSVCTFTGLLPSTNVSCFVYKTKSVRIPYVQKCIQYFQVAGWENEVKTLSDETLPATSGTESRHKLNQGLFTRDVTVSVKVTTKAFKHCLW